MERYRSVSTYLRHKKAPPGTWFPGEAGHWGTFYSGALKLYTGLMRSTISAVSWMLSSTLSPSL